tara:strand:- start:1192 stop:2100 length:909 start_codon:yes stop_codon:yes gene_type:complete
MALYFGEDEIGVNIFPHSRETDTGGGRERVGQASVIVSLDGSADTDSIQEAIDMLPPIGGTVFLKAGTYNLTESIMINKQNVQLIGEGRAAHLKNVNNKRVIWIDEVANILISGLKIEGSLTAGSVNDGIYIDESNQTIVQDCYIFNMGAHGIHLPGLSLQIHIINNEVFECAENGMEFHSCLGMIITGNRLRANKNHGMYLVNIDEGIIDSNNFLYNGTNTEAWDGINSENCDNTIFSNNVIESSRNYGIELDANSNENIIMGNMFQGNVTGAVLDNGTNTHPNGASGTNNLELDDLNILS